MSDARDGSGHYVAIYETEEEARQALERAKLAGADPSTLHMGDQRDQVTSLRAEMREELEHTAVGPGVGPFTKEMNKGMAFTIPVMTALGALVALPFALLPMPFDMGLRILTVCAVGAVAGATLGFVVGASVAVRDVDEPLAAVRGHVVVAGPGRPEIAEALDGVPGIIRLDLVTDSSDPVHTVSTSDDHTEGGTLESMGEVLRQPGHPEDHQPHH